MKTEITQIDIQNGIERAHKLRSEAFFDALEALTSPFKGTENQSPTSKTTRA